MSKIKNKIISKKNRIEKGVRASEFGSNPHSYGDDFSRDLLVFQLLCVEIIIRAAGINVVNGIRIEKIIIWSWGIVVCVHKR